MKIFQKFFLDLLISSSVSAIKTQKKANNTCVYLHSSSFLTFIALRFCVIFLWLKWKLRQMYFSQGLS